MNLSLRPLLYTILYSITPYFTQPSLRNSLLIIFDECPELFHGIELTGFVILERFSLEILVNLWPELLFQPVTEEAEETFKTISGNENEVLE